MGVCVYAAITIVTIQSKFEWIWGNNVNMEGWILLTIDRLNLNPKPSKKHCNSSSSSFCSALHKGRV
jgi:hypothetical protein